VIISASYKTDIPAFYGQWFVNRLRAGYCKVVNPYNKRIGRVSFAPEDVDGFVFWTKNLGPFLQQLPEVAAFGRPFIVQYTINGYPRALESHVTPARHSVEHVRAVIDEYKAGAVVWRYDTIVLSSLTPPAFHLENFAQLCSQLAGLVDEVVVSFMHLYEKTRRNLNRAAQALGFSWEDPDSATKASLLGELVEVARTHRLTLSLCGQPDYLVPGAQEAHCVDAMRLARMAGRPQRTPIKGNRPGCACFESRDIGEYNTCPQGCVYCYAVHDQRLAKARFQHHAPDSEFLFSPPSNAVEESESSRRVQLPLL
jgi:hypothetical protein